MVPGAFKGLALLYVIVFQLGFDIASSQHIDIEARTPSVSPPGQPNTFVATAQQVSSSLLGATTPVLLWGAVPATAIRAVCDDIVLRGIRSFYANVRGSWGGGDERLTLKLEATGGCHATADESGAEIVFTDNYSRRSAVVCPSGARAKGCGVYMTGDDVNRLHSQGLRLGSDVTETISYGLDGCRSGAGGGATGGAITGVTSISVCSGMGALAPFCAVGMLGVSAAIGAVAGCVRSCFPGGAIVELATGEFVPMNRLGLGDTVAVLKNGQKSFEDVYAFGHKDKHAVTEFMRIQLVNNITISEMALELSRHHFVPALARTGGGIGYKRAMEVKVGDMLLAFHKGGGLLPHKVTSIATVVKEGLYNPFTTGGTIIVNGVVASAHSDWFLDPLFDRFGITHLLPKVYQLLLLPVRCIYYLLGQQIYMALYNWLDSTIDIAETGSKHGAEIIMATAGTLFLAMGVAMTKR